MKHSMCISIFVLGTGLVACAAPEPLDGAEDTDETTVDEGDIQQIEQGFTESTCSSTWADQAWYSWQTTTPCGSGWRGATTVTSPNASYNHSDCTNAYVVDFSSGGRPQDVAISVSGAGIANELECESTWAKGRVFAYSATGSVEVPATSPTSGGDRGTWIPSGGISGTCTGPSVHFDIPSSVAGSSTTRVRAVGQGYRRLLTTTTYRPVTIKGSSSFCIN